MFQMISYGLVLRKAIKYDHVLLSVKRQPRKNDKVKKVLLLTKRRWPVAKIEYLFECFPTADNIGKTCNWVLSVR